MLPPNRSPSPEFSPLAIGEDLSPLPAYKAAGTASIDFGGLLGAEPLKLREDLASGCGGQTWPAGMVLGRHMLRYHRDDLRDARILELGAGGGLVGLAVAKACAVDKPLYVTDQVEMHLLMEHNIVLNHLEDKAKAAILNWGEPLPQEIVAFKPDVILAADCVYFEPAFPLLLATLSEILRLCPSATIYFCFKKRRRADMQFMRKAQKMFRVTEVEDEDRPEFSREGLFLYTFRAL
ncbi:putative methyltransferase-domain-containing protein [Hypoxylon trugodes]|uniref:putative methyltransferase-domain-containing protein n=1 Tax=Hypoxylon trugodes TaxID=326681 RepID=UPI0021A1A9A2|nr:putative methyltransferase-domain-containing protein [Hypoxylon trugodes]KAI1389550.1 putative methyltransferase-domain-containing protein [Hypoxylon trugodes]